MEDELLVFNWTYLTGALIALHNLLITHNNVIIYKILVYQI